MEIFKTNQGTGKTYDLLLCCFFYPLTSSFSFTDNKNGSYTYQILFCLHKCLVIFDCMLVMVFEKLFVENVCG